MSIFYHCRRRRRRKRITTLISSLKLMRMISRTTLLRHPSSLHVVSLNGLRQMWLFWPFVLWSSLWATLFELKKINSFSFFNLYIYINVFLSISISEISQLIITQTLGGWPLERCILTWVPPLALLVGDLSSLLTVYTLYYYYYYWDKNLHIF